MFIVGGITYEEAAMVARINEKAGQTGKVVLGGTFIHNSKSFLTELNRLKEIQAGFSSFASR